MCSADAGHILRRESRLRGRGIRKNDWSVDLISTAKGPVWVAESKPAGTKPISLTHLDIGWLRWPSFMEGTPKPRVP